jgi:hypothetical protein
LTDEFYPWNNFSQAEDIFSYIFPQMAFCPSIEFCKVEKNKKEENKVH